MVSQRHTAPTPAFPPPPTTRTRAGFDALGDVLKPAGMAGGMSAGLGGLGAGQLDKHHHIIGTGSQQHQQQQQQSSGLASGGSSKVLTGDLDSSLASLAENLTINKSASAQVK